MVRQKPGGRPAVATAKDRQRRRDIEHGGQACSVQHGRMRAMLSCMHIMVEPLTMLEIQSHFSISPSLPCV